ncbi:MAG: hypothetical protein AAGH41_11640 [Pseudomonadota bacterium]
MLTLLAALTLAPSALELAEGTWELDPNESPDRKEFTCAADPLQIEISADGKRYRSAFLETEHNADILSVAPSFLIIQYDDEQRKDDYGQPVRWVMGFPDADHFYWKRFDRVHSGQPGRTYQRRRCPKDGASA